MKSGAPKGHHKVKWTDSEWHAVALALLKVRPDYIDHPHPMIDSGELRAAMDQVLPPERHRPIPSIGGAGCGHFRPGLMRACAFIRETLAANGKSIDPELAALVDLTLPAAIPVAAPPPAAQNFRNKKRVKWTALEFNALARYLRNRYPGASYLESSTCAGLHLTDVKDAMLAALPAARHRPLFTITPLRPFFVAAFKAAKAEQYRENERAEREKDAAARQLAMLEAEPTVPPAPPMNPYEAVFAPMLKPLIALMAQELLAQLVPQIGQMVNSAVTAAMAQQQEVPDDEDYNNATTPDNVAQLRQHPAAAAPAKKLVIGIVGPLPVQAQDVQRAFPNLLIVTLDGTNTNEAVAKLRNAHRVIGMTSFMNHSMDGALARNFGARYTRVSGGVSSIKRQIHVWSASGVLAA